jgi:putative heme-binding domain-containing protein
VARVTGARNVTEAAAWLRPVLGRAQGVNSLAAVVKAKPLTPEAATRMLAALGSLGRGEGNLFQPLTEQAGFTGTALAYDSATVTAIADGARSTGNAAEGRKLYEMLGCINCHAINGEGGKTGPDLSALSRGLPLDGIVTEVLWPQLNVKEGFSATRAQTRDGRIVEGLLESESADTVAIRDLLSGETTKLRRAEIASLKTGGSPMPEGLTSSLSRQQIADLIRYLSDLGKN